MLYNNCVAVNTRPCPKPWTQDPTEKFPIIIIFFGQGRNSVFLASDNILNFSIFSYAPFRPFFHLWPWNLMGPCLRKIPVGNYGPVWDTLSILPFCSEAAHLHSLHIIHYWKNTIITITILQLIGLNCWIKLNKTTIKIIILIGDVQSWTFKKDSNK